VVSGIPLRPGPIDQLTKCTLSVKALLLRDQRLFGGFLRRDKELFKLAISARSEFFGQLQHAGAIRDDIPANVLAYVVSVTGYGLIAGDEVVPEESKVPFGEAIRAWGLLLEHAVAPAQPSNPEAARAPLIAMVEKMQTALRGLDRPSGDLGKPSTENRHSHHNTRSRKK
jgi:hypothetical protein